MAVQAQLVAWSIIKLPEARPCAQAIFELRATLRQDV